MNNLNRPLHLTAVKANKLQRSAQAIEEAVIAISEEMSAPHCDCFTQTLAGLLETDTATDCNITQEQLEIAYRWIFDNYNRLAATVYAARTLAGLATQHTEAAGQIIKEGRA